MIRSGAGIGGSPTVDFSTGDGSAHAPGDYTAKTSTLSYAAGEVEKIVLVDITDDDTAEPSESFDVKLANPSAGATVGRPSAPVTITDDDSAASQVGFEVSSYRVAEGGDVTVTVARTGKVSSAVSVDYVTIAQSAGADVDYLSGADTLDFDPGDVSQSFDIPLVADSLHEGDEAFVVNLANQLPAGTTLGLAGTTVTIADDDPQPTISAGGASSDGGSVSFDIHLSNPTTETVTVTYVITDAAGNPVATGTATIPAGQSGTTVSGVPVSGDGPWTVHLSNPSGGTLDPAATSSATGPAPAAEPTVSVTPGTGTGTGPAGSSPVTFDVGLSAPAATPVTVDYEIKAPDGTIIGTGTVTIPAGETSVPVTVTVPSGLTGPFTVVLTNPTGATVAGGGASASVAPHGVPAAAVASAPAADPAPTTVRAGASACRLSVKGREARAPHEGSRGHAQGRPRVHGRPRSQRQGCEEQALQLDEGRPRAEDQAPDAEAGERQGAHGQAPLLEAGARPHHAGHQEQAGDDADPGGHRARRDQARQQAHAALEAAPVAAG